MKANARDLFTSVHTEGGLLPADFLGRIAAGDREIEGLAPDTYHLAAGERINEAATRAWNRLSAAWAAFRGAASKLAEDDPATSLTRERWLLILFQELGYGRLMGAKTTAIDGKNYPISHFWQKVPIHLAGFRVNLDRRTVGVAGAARTSPHSLVQEFLNRSAEHLWGFVSNGLHLRILRDNASLTRDAYIEFDLEAMMEGEVYADFVLLWLLSHESRVEAEKAEECWLERWTRAAREQGTRALDTLRDGVEAAIKALGAGLLAHPANTALRDRLRSGALSTQEYYRQLLRLVYRLLFLFVAEDRNLLLDPQSDSAARERYLHFYSAARLRLLAERCRGTKHPDLYRGLRLVMEKLGCDEGCLALALPALGSFLWSEDAIPDLARSDLANEHLLDAVRALGFTTQERLLRAVDYKNLASEELGSVYESLLELYPEVNVDAARFDLKTAAGHERKTTGSYYTPSSLVQCLLDSALNPVLDEAARKRDAERAILCLKVCDPACGSGHFLIAAAHRIAKRLAVVRTGDEEPSPEATRTALRDVIGHCIHGVDRNPMAVELCKVALWMEAIEPGKPLSFLESHIQCGDSLVGILDPTVMEEGIPGEAYAALTGDDKAICSALKKRNRESGACVQGSLFEPGGLEKVVLATAALDAMPEEKLADIEAKRRAWEAARADAARRQEELRANLYVGAFFAPKTRENLDLVPITEDLNRIRQGLAPRPGLEQAVEGLAARHSFFHWHIAFAKVMQKGGFDVVLGNPPWEVSQLNEIEYFAGRMPEIAAQAGEARKRAIRHLESEHPALWLEYKTDKREFDAKNAFARMSGRFPLTTRGKLNTYALFAETFLNLIAPRGRAGLIVPTGIATDDTTKAFFEEVSTKGRLASLYDFENREALFPAVDSRMKFCLLTLGREIGRAEFVFFATRTEQLADARRRFTLSPADILRINPNTKTAPVFRSQADAELTRKIYDRVPVLIDESKGDAGNPWGISFRQGLFNMTSDSGLFRTWRKLEEAGARREGVNWIDVKDAVWVPLYEAKMIHQFDHRWATYEADGETSRDATEAERRNAAYEPSPRYWVPAGEVEERLREKGWTRGWLMGWRDICCATNERTVIAGVVPRVGVSNKLPLVFADPKYAPLLTACFAANLAALSFDFVARQKIGGTTLNFFYIKQFPVLPPSAYSPADLDFIVPRVLELTYTSEAMRPFARDLGHDGPPFAWDPDRRAIVRAELDAYYARLYSLTRDELRYILDPADVYGEDYPSETFRVLKDNEKRSYGEYRTRRLVLEKFDELARPVAVTVPSLPARVEPFQRVEPRPADRYRTCVPLLTLKAAAGTFGNAQNVEPDGWVKPNTRRALRPGMFVAQVVGRSMEPRIPDGAWCLFASPVEGSRQGRIVLVQHRDIHDPETGGSYTVKRYESDKEGDGNGSWRHTEIRLKPENPEFEPITLRSVIDNEIHVIAEFLEVLSAHE